MTVDAQSHYDAQALKRSSRKERNDGAAAALKKYHNAVKRALIQAFAPQGGSLLDLACGRGGDLQKWKDAGLSRVTGIDVSHNALEEAKRRHRAVAKELQCTFLHSTNLGKEVWTSSQKYDMVTCMFALHYFFSSESTALTFLRTVAANVRPGGHFVCVVPDGLRINTWLMNNTRSPLARITARWCGPPEAFGSAYVFAIQDTVTAETQACEYLVYERVLVKLAEMVGLVAVTELPDACQSMLQSSQGAFKHFLPHSPVSPLFAACVFVRMP